MAEPMDFLDVLPTCLDIAVDGFNGCLLADILAPYGQCVNRGVSAMRQIFVSLERAL
ncbi:hypothetical protein [Citrobacter sp. S-77]|uniref:hypothetical protein n=1 Tax=Citrobacter sp. S-77 TaxID=1080067 RepID=UPI0016810974|nr:hypothetical protein [Citrobacter sp. S-77]